MNITAKHIDRSNVIFLFQEGSLRLPEPAQVFAAYGAEQTKGALFSDNTATATRIFEFAALGVQWVFEPSKIRLEDKKHAVPSDSKLPVEMLRLVDILYPGARPVVFGFNYDAIYRMDSVIPVGSVMNTFVRSDIVEQVKDFGWQYTLSKDKGKRSETYFFKAVSPIEFAVHANFQWNEPYSPKAHDLEKLFEKAYGDMDKSLAHMAI